VSDGQRHLCQLSFGHLHLHAHRYRCNHLLHHHRRQLQQRRRFEPEDSLAEHFEHVLDTLLYHCIRTVSKLALTSC